MPPRTATLPVPAIDPLVRAVAPLTVTEPSTVNATAEGMVRLATVRVVPAGTVTAPRISIVLRGWLPVMVRVPAKITVEVVGSTVPVVTVQLRPVRMVPVRVSVPDGLAISRLGNAPALVVAVPVND